MFQIIDEMGALVRECETLETSLEVLRDLHTRPLRVVRDGKVYAYTARARGLYQAQRKADAA